MEHLIMIFNDSLLHGGWLYRIIATLILVYAFWALLRARLIKKGVMALFISFLVLFSDNIIKTITMLI